MIVLHSVDAYIRGEKWFGSGNNYCTDSQLLFEYIVAKPEDLISSLTLSFFDKDGSVEINYPSSIWSAIDHNIVGRCFTANITSDLIKYGIEKAELVVNTNVRVYFHTAGMVITDRQKRNIDITSGKRIEIDLEHEEFNMLDFEGQFCNNDKGYSKDLCVNEEFERNSFNNYGCTSPFGPNKNFICKDPKKGIELMNLYRQNVDHVDSTCPQYRHLSNM